MTFRNALLTLVLVPLAACSSFAAAERSSLEPGQAIRVELSADQTAQMADDLGGFRESLTGTVQELDDGGVGLTISDPRQVGVPATRNLRSYVYLPWDGVTTLERREFNLLQTGLLAAGGAAAAWAILELTTGGGGVGEDGPGTNNGRVSVPIFGFAF